MSTERVNLICQSCAEYNGGKWRNGKAYADPLLGECDVCKNTTIITNVHHYKGIHPEKHFLLPIETPKNKAVDPKVNSNLDPIIDDILNPSSDNLNLDLDSDLTLNVNANRKTSNKPKNKVLT